MQYAMEWIPIRLKTATSPFITEVNSWSGFFYYPCGPVWTVLSYAFDEPHAQCYLQA